MTLRWSFGLSLLHFFVERNFNKAGGASLSVRTYILPVAVIAYYMTLVIGSIMFVPHSPQPALHTCGWASGPGALTGPHAREKRERETERESCLTPRILQQNVGVGIFARGL